MKPPRSNSESITDGFRLAGEGGGFWEKNILVIPCCSSEGLWRVSLLPIL